MARFHVGRDGNPKECTAEAGKCPLGGEHYDSEEACEKAIEKTNASKNSRSSSSLKKTSVEHITSFATIDLDQFGKSGKIQLDPNEEYVVVLNDDVEDKYPYHGGDDDYAGY